MTEIRERAEKAVAIREKLIEPYINPTFLHYTNDVPALLDTIAKLQQAAQDVVKAWFAWSTCVAPDSEIARYCDEHRETVRCLETLLEGGKRDE